MLVNESFYHVYECKVITSPPAHGIQMYCYPGGIADGWVHGIGVEIIPDSSKRMWVGSFANGDLSPNATSGVFTHPARNRLLVVAKGDGHVVNVDDPTDFAWLDQIVPIIGVVPIPVHGRILIYDFVRILALGEEGVLWRTPRLSWDGLTIERIEDDVVRGYGWDATNDCNAPFEINVLSGRFSGGASPELLGIA
jgi:hypothetical protein